MKQKHIVLRMAQPNSSRYTIL